MHPPGIAWVPDNLTGCILQHVHNGTPHSRRGTHSRSYSIDNCHRSGKRTRWRVMRLETRIGYLKVVVIGRRESWQDFEGRKKKQTKIFMLVKYYYKRILAMCNKNFYVLLNKKMLTFEWYFELHFIYTTKINLLVLCVCDFCFDIWINRTCKSAGTNTRGIRGVPSTSCPI